MLPTSLSRLANSAEYEQEFFEAAPQGDPAGGAVAFAAEVAAQAGQVSHELVDGHVGGRGVALGGQCLDPFAGCDLVGGGVGGCLG